jgi:predicted GTPase
MAESAWQKWERIDMKNAEKRVQKYGMTGIETFFKTELDGWKDLVINIAITGDAGAGKSSFINSIRR